MSVDELKEEMTNGRGERVTKVNKTTTKKTSPEGSIKSMLQEIDLKDISVAALLATAGIGGYILGRWPNTQQTPEIAQAYLWFGLALGIAITSAFIVANKSKPEEKEE